MTCPVLVNAGGAACQLFADVLVTPAFTNAGRHQQARLDHIQLNLTDTSYAVQQTNRADVPAMLPSSAAVATGLAKTKTCPRISRKHARVLANSQTKTPGPQHQLLQLNEPGEVPEAAHLEHGLRAREDKKQGRRARGRGSGACTIINANDVTVTWFRT